MRVLMRKDLQQLSCFDSCWGLSVFAESTVVLVSQNLPKLSYKQLCRDMELTLMNVSAEQAFSLIELHEHLNSSHFPGSFGIIESSTLVSAIVGNGEAEDLPQQFHCKEGFLDRCGECEQIFMLPCVMCSVAMRGSTSLIWIKDYKFEDADVEAETTLDLDASVVVQSMLLVEKQQMRWRQQFPVV